MIPRQPLPWGCDPWPSTCIEIEPILYLANKFTIHYFKLWRNITKLCLEFHPLMSPSICPIKIRSGPSKSLIYNHLINSLKWRHPCPCDVTCGCRILKVKGCLISSRAYKLKLYECSILFGLLSRLHGNIKVFWASVVCLKGTWTCFKSI